MELKHFLLSLVGCSFLVSIFPLPLVLVLVVVAILLSDADLTLIACSKFGRKREVLRGQVIWITCASSGIGEYLAYELAKVGCKLILSARRVDELEKVKTKCEVLSPSGFKDAHSVIKLDLLDYESHSNCVEEVLKKYDRIDCLVINAGRSQKAEAVNTSLEVDKAVLNLHTIGTISVTKAVLPQMRKQSKGLIVIVSNLAGKMGSPCAAAYSASKHALQGYFDALRMELFETGIDVLSVCPGPVATEASVNASSTDTNTSVERGNSTAEGMGVERCCDLMVVAMANRLHEVWISPHPVLLFAYVSQFMPATSKWIGQWVGGNRVKAFRQGSPAHEQIQAKASEVLEMPPVLDVREPIERVISVDEQLQDYDSHRHVFVDISISASNKDRYIVVREVDGALREATWDERDRMNQIYYPKTGRKLNMPRMLTGDYLPDVLKNKRHLDVLDLCNVQCEADSPQYIEIHKTVYDDIIENNLYDLLHSTRHFGGLVWYIVRTKKVQGFVENLLKRDMLEDLIAFVDLYHLAYPDEGAEHPENTSQEVTDEERSDHKVNMFLNEIGLKGTVQLKRSTSTS